jgi:hypothetical protein
MPENSKAWKQSLAAAAVVAVLFVAALLILIELPGKETGNPYEYDLTPYKAIPPEMYLYSEYSRIPIDMNKTWGIAAGPGDRIFVSGERAVEVFRHDGGKIRSFDLPEPGRAIGVSNVNDIYIGHLRHVSVYSDTGELVSAWTDLGRDAIITSLAVGANDVFVADCGQRLLWRFNRQGSLAGVIGRKNRTLGEPGFLVPGVCFDAALGPDGRLWVVAPGRFQVLDRARGLLRLRKPDPLRRQA